MVELEVASGAEAAATLAGDDDGNIARVVGISVADGRAEGDHRVVEQGAVAFLELFHAVEHVGVLLGVPVVDFFILVELAGIVLVVGNRVVPAVDAVKEREIASGHIVAEHEGGDAGGVRPEAEDDEVHHDARVFAVVEAGE